MAWGRPHRLLHMPAVALACRASPCRSSGLHQRQPQHPASTPPRRWRRGFANGERHRQQISRPPLWAPVSAAAAETRWNPRARSSAAAPNEREMHRRPSNELRQRRPLQSNLDPDLGRIREARRCEDGGQSQEAPFQRHSLSAARPRASRVPSLGATSRPKTRPRTSCQDRPSSRRAPRRGRRAPRASSRAIRRDPPGSAPTRPPEQRWCRIREAQKLQPWTTMADPIRAPTHPTSARTRTCAAASVRHPTP
mmetsp:Transcript_147288/g.473152  ORF Transcript_147288/g.473152 Transcript_147288/m.473152 type:complete len:252 (-) Transcript_147288:257-1012(-)